MAEVWNIESGRLICVPKWHTFLSLPATLKQPKRERFVARMTAADKELFKMAAAIEGCSLAKFILYHTIAVARQIVAKKQPNPAQPPPITAVCGSVARTTASTCPCLGSRPWPNTGGKLPKPDWSNYVSRFERGSNFPSSAGTTAARRPKNGNRISYRIFRLRHFSSQLSRLSSRIVLAVLASARCNALTNSRPPSPLPRNFSSRASLPSSVAGKLG